MKEGEVIVGTVRAKRHDDQYVVVRRDGTVLDVTFRGDTKPIIGGDVVGRLHFDDFGNAEMRLKESVLDVIMEGSHRIIMMGRRSDITARMLAKLLARSRSAVVSPGAGVSIERAPVSEDGHLNWALDAFSDEAMRRGVALNVIDVQAVARSNWETASLRDSTLPADVEGSIRSLNDLTVLLRAGFKPYCSRMTETITGNKEISLNFILPYSPFAGPSSFARDLAAMGSRAFPLVSMDLDETRKFCAARTIALGLAHNCLGAAEGLQADVESSPRARHIAACFADATASLLFLRDGGRSTVLAEIADLKEASLHYGQSRFHTTPGTLKEGVLGQATHKALRAAFAADVPHDASMREIIAIATKIAKKVALPASRFGAEDGRDVATEREMKAASLVAKNIGINFSGLHDDQRQAVEDRYRYEIRQLVSEFATNENASARLALFEGYNVPDDLKAVFDEEAGHLYALSKSPDEVTKKAVIDRDRLATRIRGRHASDLENDYVQYGESLPSPRF